MQRHQLLNQVAYIVTTGLQRVNEPMIQSLMTVQGGVCCTTGPQQYTLVRNKRMSRPKYAN
jgi:hypothetical protein